MHARTYICPSILQIKPGQYVPGLKAGKEDRHIIKDKLPVKV